jgi:L-arabinose isomerase
MSAHMREVCESIADGRAKLEVHPLSIGGKEDPVRLVFDAVAIIDLGNRLIVNEVDPVKPLQPLPRLVEVPTRL